MLGRQDAPYRFSFRISSATLVGSVMNAGLVDELHLIVNPLVLAGGKALLKDVKDRQALKLVRAKPLASGKVSLAYSTNAAQK
jgi:dihydrofolate reductase